MPFKYSCFISYRAGERQRENPYIVGVINSLRDHLSYELELLLDEEVREVYIDWSRLQGGDFFDEELAQALCQSVCMIVVYTPTYFSRAHTYCAREYKAMEKLETERLKLLSAQAYRKRGLIIPIVLRYKNRLPREIKSRRQCYDFEDFLQDEKRIRKPAGYFREVKKIALYIFERYLELSTLTRDPCSNCTKFRLPTDKQIGPWLARITNSRALGRETRR